MFKSVFSNVKLKLQLKAAMPTFDTTPAARPLNLHGTTEKKGTRVMGVGEIGEPGGEGGRFLLLFPVYTNNGQCKTCTHGVHSTVHQAKGNTVDSAN